MNKEVRTVDVYDAAEGRTVKRELRISGSPVDVKIPGMLAVFGYEEVRTNSKLKVLRGMFGGECFIGMAGGSWLLIMECWVNPNGHLGAHDMMLSREMALKYGADFFGEYANIDPQCGLPAWGVDYSIFPFDLLTDGEKAEFMYDYQQCRSGEINGHRPLLPETVAKMQKIFGAPVAYATV